MSNRPNARLLVFFERREDFFDELAAACGAKFDPSAEEEEESPPSFDIVLDGMRLTLTDIEEYDSSNQIEPVDVNFSEGESDTQVVGDAYLTGDWGESESLDEFNLKVVKLQRWADDIAERFNIGYQIRIGANYF